MNDIDIDLSNGHGVELVYFEADAITMKGGDPMRAIGIYDPKTKKVKELQKIVALKEAGCSITYGGRHPKTGFHYYRVGEGLFESSQYEEKSNTRSFVDLCLEAL
ncbi:hypothetical protein [Vibrio harveyi]|uniref:hypothetical protein n=1 Tax=Vibrio harveyi TaxID=669 RepID=UPI003CFB6411